MIYSIRLVRLLKGLMAILFVLSQNVLWSQGSAAILTGIVTNAITNAPITGARITVGAQTVYSVYGGGYTMSIDPPGTYSVTCYKTGYDPFTSAPILFQSGVTTTLNFPLWENPNPPVNVNALLVQPAPDVHITWALPSGPYELIYDDGLQDNFTVWATQGNQNAVRFTPVGYPATITGGSVNIGNTSNYPAGTNPFVPFQVIIYDANGPGGKPGNPISSPIDITPSSLGWISFTVGSPPVISSGSFYVVMVQGGNYPNTAGLAVDETTPQLRSWSRFVTGSGLWIPASGNFMIRAIVSSSGGPVMLPGNSSGLLGYQIWRLQQGEEQNPAVWVSAGLSSTTSFYDNSWPSLPCGAYLWAIKAQYTGNRWSSASFSNVIGKCWTAAVSIQVPLSCSAINPAGSFVLLQNLVYPDTLYSSSSDTIGNVTFPEVWKGTYTLDVTRFGYQPIAQMVSISHDTSIIAQLMQIKAPPTNLTVNNQSLFSTWNQPVYREFLLDEDWNSGNFTANGWTIEGGYNWLISTADGNPAPSATFSYLPQVVNYNESLISKSITGENSPILNLTYDIFLDNFGNTTVNQMAVELWDGISWHLLKNYDNTGGDIPWTHASLDISTYTNTTFKIRFRAYGGDSYDINRWSIDNIHILAEEPPASIKSCILGYNYYLNGILCGFVHDTSYFIPGNLVQYGSYNNACVLAVYGSGYSTDICTSFISDFLFPPRAFYAIGIEDVAYLRWEKPLLNDTTIAPGLLGYTIYRDGTYLSYLSSPDSLNYYDYNLDPGTYVYGVAAKYDLTSYGFPGQFDESVPAGPDTVVINYGRLLPFWEPWVAGNFTFNEWTFDPDQGNWIINADAGVPQPCAEFSWSPPQTDYSFSLVSPVLSAANVHCGTVSFDFNYRLLDQVNTGWEKLAVDVYYNNLWHNIIEYSDTGFIDWTFQHLNINFVREKSFKIRFRAYGLNSAAIQAWDIDNINIYAICNPALNLSGEAWGLDTHLSWSPPHCEEGIILNEGFEETFFPPQYWTQIITDPAATWIHTPANSILGVHSGNYSAGVTWDYGHQNEWLIVHNVAVTGNLKFWSNTFQGSTHLDHYYVKMSLDSGANWSVLLDMSALPPYPGPNGYNLWNTPYIIDMSPYAGQVIDIAWQAVDGDGLGLWYSWAIDDITMNGKKSTSFKESLSLLGYDVFRQDTGVGGFKKINTELVTDTTYIDPGLDPGLYRYYVNAIFDECTLITPSDTVFVDVMLGVPEQHRSRIKVFPNPSTGEITIVSSEMIEKIEIMNYSGTRILNEEDIHKQQLSLNLSGFPGGIYLFKVVTLNETGLVKLVISK